ncbi:MULTISPECIES: hypothetical protein [unclassified Empedobacter]|uniref:hypothetical protein n=1 Tax=unclassified Empedobacter TaxID=2643773 RepID=UPI0025C70EFD|nr:MULTISPECIES: hypothetical protein [unclassified Empedobacter]
MESKTTKIILLSISIGIWIIVLQNFGIFSEEGTQEVRVTNTIDVEGNVKIKEPVEIGNTVDINISEINGHSDVFFNNYNSNPNKYYRLPIIDK